MRSWLWLGGMLLIASSTTAAPQIYQWVDGDGVTHFSSAPPPNARASLVESHTPLSRSMEVMPPSEPKSEPSPAPEASSATSFTTDSSQRAIERQVRQQVAEQNEEMKEYCIKLRTSLAHLRVNPRVHVPDGDDVRKLREEERQQRMQDLEQRIAESCP